MVGNNGWIKRGLRAAGAGLAVAALAAMAGCVTQTPAGNDAHRQAPKAAAKETPTKESSDPAAAATAGIERTLAKAAAEPPAPFEGDGWEELGDGRTLAGWTVTDFGGHGEVRCQSGMIILGAGDSLTGVNWSKPAPKVNYEISLEAMRVEGSDFFCGLTFPVQDTHCSLILGGWGGSVVGISSIDGNDASENETSQGITFENGHWYRVRLRVKESKIEAWLDDKKIVDLDTTGRKITMRYGEIELSKPLGLATWQTTGALRRIAMRRLDAGAK